MTGRISSYRSRVIHFVFAMLAWLACSVAFAQPPTGEISRQWLKDVELTDLFFLNENLGWVVGEHGTILKTSDGGETWNHTANIQTIVEKDLALDANMQRVMDTLRENVGEHAAPMTRAISTGINFRFKSIHFADARNGLVVGGYDIPYVNRSRAVVMKTTDGGATWKHLKALVIPRLEKVHMADPFHAWAVGDEGNLFGAGIYTSIDGGQSWSNEFNGAQGSFVDAQRSGQAVIAIDEAGRLNRIAGSKVELSTIQGVPQSVPVSAVKMVDANYGWAVGHGGQILQTSDAGKSWILYEPTQLQNESKFDFSALTIANGKIWFAGNPGTYIFSIGLSDGKLERFRTPISTSIRAIAFPTSTHGWAIGDAGTILHSNDGGMTWAAQKVGARRVAVLAVSFDQADFPLETLAQYSSENNLVCATLHFSLGSENKVETERLKQAASRVGCNICNVVYPRGQNLSADSIRQLTLAIRSLKPNAIVCEGTAFRLPNGSVVDPQQLISQAAKAAADRHQYSDQLTEIGLATWQIDRLAVFDRSGQGELKTNSDRLLPLTGQSISDHCAISAALVGLPVGQVNERTFRVKDYTIGSVFRGSDVLEGLKRLGRQIPHRNEANIRRGNLQAIQNNVSRRKELERLAKWSDTSPRSLLVWRQQLNSLVVGQETDLAGVWLANLGNQYMQAGRWQMAAYALNQLVGRYPEHPLSSASLIWLAQYHASDEMLADRIQTDELSDMVIEEDEIEDLLRMEVNPASFQAAPQSFQKGGMNHMVWVPNEVKNEIDQELAGGVLPPKIDPLTESLQQASSIVTKIRARDPDLVRDPHVRFFEAKLISRIQSGRAAENQFQQIVRNSSPADPLFEAGKRELQLVKGLEAEFAGPVGLLIDQRPELNGQLNDECWNKAFENGTALFQRMTPPGADGQPKTDVVVVGYDDEFLYLAARCNKLNQYPYRKSEEPRTRDPDLVNRDRIEFAIDTDRDYQSFLQFSVDHRGWCAEGANGSNNWDPEWFVAQAEDEKSWSIELAIPLRQLTASRITDETAWGISIARRVGRNSPNLWPSRSLDFESYEVGLQTVSKMMAQQFELLKFQQ